MIISEPKSDKGQSLAEYALVLALVTTAAIAGVKMLGDSLTTQFDQVASKLNGLPTNSTATVVNTDATSGNSCNQGCGAGGDHPKFL